MRGVMIGVAVAAAMTVGTAGQTFDVASIKPSPQSAFGFPGLMLQPGGRVTSPGTSTRQLILVAYGLDDLQLVGGPSWIGNDLYTVDARAADGTDRAGVRAMLKALLTERFRLAVHVEPRELPSYALVMANRDRRLGTRMRRSGPTCAPIAAPPGVPIPPPPPPGPESGITPVLPRDPLGQTCGYISFPGWISGRQVRMGQFVQALTSLVRRPVVDETGLDGAFDFDVTFTPDSQTSPGAAPFAPAPAPGAAGPAPPPTDRPSLFTALQEDLGLKLDARRRPVDVVVIDRIERPAEN